MRIQLIALVFLAIFLRDCSDGKIVVDPLKPGTKADPIGVLYALPNTVARIQLKVDKTTKKGAPYSPFAAIFAPDDKPVCKFEKYDADSYSKCLQAEDTYSLQDGAAFSTYGEPDPERVFVVRFTGKGTIDQSLSMTWNEAGVLSAASASVTNRTGDVIISGLKLVTGLGIKAAFGAGKIADDGKVPPCEKPVKGPDGDQWILDELNKAGATEAVLRANYCQIKYEDRQKLTASRKKPAIADPEKTFETLLQEAVSKYAAEVGPLLTARTEILEGKSRVFEPAALLPRIEGEITQKLTSLFLGTEKTKTWDGSVDIRALNKDEIVVMRIKEHEGVCLKEAELAPDSKPIPAKFTILSDRQCDAAGSISINLGLTYSPKRENQLFDRIEDRTTGERSFRYRIPAQMKAELFDQRKNDDGVEVKTVYGSAAFSVAQRGTVISLPATRHSKTLSYEIALIEETGGMKTFKLGTSGGLDAATVDALAGVGGSIIDARNKRQQEKEAEEVNRLTKQQQLLKLQDEICTIQKKYGLPCTTQPQ